MKKYLLLIISSFIFSLSFANTNSGFENPFREDNQTDTSKININDLQKLKLYPNPVSSYLFIDYEIVFVKDAKLQIYNSIGAIVYTKTLIEKQDNIKVPVFEYENGLYFCTLRIDGNLLSTKKILINH